MPRLLDPARRRIGALARLPLVPAVGGDEAAGARKGVAPHRLVGRLLEARVEARLRRLRLLPPVRHHAPAPGRELEPVRARRHAQERDGVGRTDVVAARERIRIVSPPELERALERALPGADEAAAHRRIIFANRPRRLAWQARTKS